MKATASTPLILFAALFGAAGTAGAALAAHGFGGDLIAIAAAIAFVHAPALLALGLAPPGRMRAPLVPGLLIALGVVLFSGDLAARVVLGGPIFPNAAPLGGTLLIAGWLGTGLAALLPRKAPRSVT